MRKIIVQAYNPNWKLEFEKAKASFLDLLSAIEVKVEHVGSTSIEELWAKPILDIDIIVKNDSDSKKVIGKLESVGYTHIGNLGVEGREVLKYKEGNPFIQWMDHHLYVCKEDCENLRNHLLIRRHLRNNREAVKAYSELKRQLAQAFPHDINSYIDGKTDLLTQFLKEEGMESSEINRIESINKKIIIYKLK